MARKRTSSKRPGRKNAAGEAAAGSKPSETPTRRAGRASSLLDTRIVYCGDCLDQLAKLPDGCVDLIYIDPPFNSNRNYEVFWGERSEPRAQASGFLTPFEDRHANHYIKVMLDQMLGEDNPQNEPTWKKFAPGEHPHLGHVL